MLTAREDTLRCGFKGEKSESRFGFLGDRAHNYARLGKAERSGYLFQTTRAVHRSFVFV